MQGYTAWVEGVGRMEAAFQKVLPEEAIETKGRGWWARQKGQLLQESAEEGRPFVGTGSQATMDQMGNSKLRGCEDEAPGTCSVVSRSQTG